VPGRCLLVHVGRPKNSEVSETRADDLKTDRKSVREPAGQRKRRQASEAHRNGHRIGKIVRERINTRCAIFRGAAQWVRNDRCRGTHQQIDTRKDSCEFGRNRIASLGRAVQTVRAGPEHGPSHRDATHDLWAESTGGQIVATRRAELVSHLLDMHVTAASQMLPSLRSKRVTPHVLRHTSAMQLLHSGVDTAAIALWLGHESSKTTQVYLHADLSLKERALSRTTPATSKPGRYRPTDHLLAFLDHL